MVLAILLHLKVTLNMFCSAAARMLGFLITYFIIADNRRRKV